MSLKLYEKEYVQVKPALALVTIILKAIGKYNEGDLRANSGYLYVSIVYNISICMALYCLAIFWMCVSDDLKPFRCALVLPARAYSSLKNRPIDRCQSSSA